MKQELLFELITAFNQSSITELEYCEGESRIALRRTAPVAEHTAILPQPAATPLVCVPATPPVCKEEAAVIKAPLVGTFYAASSPGAQPFVQVGDTVKKGQTVCILEAMKMINEIPAPFDCVIEECCVKDGALAGFDEVLFVVREL